MLLQIPGTSRFLKFQRSIDLNFKCIQAYISVRKSRFQWCKLRVYALYEEVPANRLFHIQVIRESQKQPTSSPAAASACTFEHAPAPLLSNYPPAAAWGRTSSVWWLGHTQSKLFSWCSVFCWAERCRRCRPPRCRCFYRRLYHLLRVAGSAGWT